LNEKVGDHFCQVISLLWLQQKVLPYTKYGINYEYFYQKLSRPTEKRQTCSGAVTCGYEFPHFFTALHFVAVEGPRK